MKTVLFSSILTVALMASTGKLASQDKGVGDQPAANQSAPSESTDAAGHDAQTGKPKTAEKPNGQDGVKHSGDGKDGSDSMKPATAQSPPPATAKPDVQKITLTEDQAKSWIDKLVFSSDGKELGEVAAFKRATDNTVVEMHADIGGFIGIGETRIKVTPAEFKLQDDRVVLTLTEEQAKALPKLEN